MISTADLIFAVALFAVVLSGPVFGWRKYRQFERELALGLPNTRSRAFLHTILMQWTTAGLLFAGWCFTSTGFESVFLVPGWSGWQWLAVGIGLLLSGAMVTQTIVVCRREGQLAKLRDQLGTIASLAPRTPRERRLFDAISLTAGVCEELVYRGLLLGTLASWIGLWPAVVGSTLLFGLGHAYQGAGGVIKTGLVGAVFALLTVFSGSIYLAVVVHAILDLSQGRMIARAVRGSDPQQPPRAKDGREAIPLGSRPAGAEAAGTV